jgi:hypothetical protein
MLFTVRWTGFWPYRTGAMQDLGYELPRRPLPHTPGNTSRGQQVTLRQRLDAVAGSDPTAREYVGSQSATVYEATQHSGPR